MSSTLPQDLGEAYVLYRPLLFTALSKIAKAGVAIPFGDGLDLVHDFFIEQYPRLRESYDSNKSSIATYLFLAFYRFARTRVLSYARSTRLLAQEDLDQEAVAGIDNDVERTLDLDSLRTALHTLSEDDQRLLQLRFEEGGSDRATAKQLGVSRYAARERVLNAIAQISLALKSTGQEHDRDLLVARLTWLEQRPIEEIADLLSITSVQAKAAKNRFLANLSGNLHAMGHSKTTQKNGDI